jgi:hypothetical protein
MALVKNCDNFTGWCNAAGGLVRKGAYQKMLDGLAALSVPEPAKRQFEELIRKSAALDGISSIDRQERVKFARHLLDQRESRATICLRLQAKYGIGRSQAYLVIAEAL